MLGVVVVALTAFLFFSGSSLSLPFNSDPHALLASDSLGIKTGPLPRTAMPIDSGGTKLGVRDTSAKKDTMTILSKSFDSHPQNISGSDSLGIRTRALPKIAALPDSTGIKLGVRDTSANKDSLIFFPNSLGFHFREMSGIESLVSKTVPMPKLGATDESSRRDSLLRLPKRPEIRSLELIRYEEYRAILPPGLPNFSTIAPILRSSRSLMNEPMQCSGNLLRLSSVLLI